MTMTSKAEAAAGGIPGAAVVEADENDGGLLGMATELLRRQLRPVQRAALHARGMCRAPDRCRRGRRAVGVRRPHRSRARGLLELFHRRGLLPRTLKFLAALGDLDGVRACLDTNSDDLAAVNEAFMYACRFQHETVAALLLDRSIALDRRARRADRWRAGTFRIRRILHRGTRRRSRKRRHRSGPWQAFVMQQVMRAMHEAT